MKLSTCVRLVLPLAGLLASPAAAQSDVAEDAERLNARINEFLVQQDVARESERVEDLLHRLEVGMSALEELGRRDALEHVRRIADELREARHGLQVDRLRLAAPRDEAAAERAGQDKERETVRRRLKVMRLAVDAYVAAGNHRAAHLVELAMRARELALEGVRGEEAEALRAEAPDRGELAGLLDYAARIYTSQGKAKMAQALADLAAVYAEQHARVTALESSGAHEPDLDALEVRVEILAEARKAFAEAGKDGAVAQLDAALAYGRLHLGGADEERLAEAAEAVPALGQLCELCFGASRLWAEYGHEKRARLCGALAQHYAELAGLELGFDARGAEAEHAHEPDLEQRAARVEIIRVALAAHEEAGNEAGAGMLRRFARIGELQLEGADPEAINRAAQGEPALSMGALTDLIAQAADVYAGRGDRERAHWCAALARFYETREAARAEGDEPEPEPEPADDDEHEGHGLDDLGRRIEIIERAAGALRRASARDEGLRAQASSLAKAVAFGRLMLEGASEETLEAHSEGIPSIPELIELLDRAAGLYADWDRADDARLCRSLAAFYAHRDADDDDVDDDHDVEDDHHADDDDHAGSLRPDQGQGDIDELAYRVEIIRSAVAAWREAGDEQAHDEMTRFLQVAELQLEGADGATMAQAFEGLTTDLVIERLRGAARTYRRWGIVDRAQSCAALADFYTARWGGGGDDTAEEPRRWNLDERADRVDVLRLARAAQAEAGHAEAAELLARMVRIGELQLAGGPEEAITEIAMGPTILTMPAVIELVQHAAGLYRNRGNDERAELCAGLADFYRDREATPDSKADPDPATLPPIERPVDRIEAEQRALIERLAELEARLARLTAEIEKLRAIRRR